MAYGFNEDKSRKEIPVYSNSFGNSVTIPKTMVGSTNQRVQYNYTFSADGYLQLFYGSNTDAGTNGGTTAEIDGTTGNMAIRGIHCMKPYQERTIFVKKGMKFVADIWFASSGIASSFQAYFCPLIEE